MKLLERTCLGLILTANFFILGAINANAQNKTGMTMEKNNMTSGVVMRSTYIVPEKPEDISPLLDGEVIPEVNIPDASGKDFDLNKAVASQPTVLVFYRGGWCPFCSRQLAGLQRAYPNLKKMGYQLIAISTDDPKHLSVSAMKEHLEYTLLSDADLGVAKKFGLAYKAPAAYGKILPESSGGKNTDLLVPVPSVFILNKKGAIQFEYINPDFKQRLDPDLLMAAAKSLYSKL